MKNKNTSTVEMEQPKKQTPILKKRVMIAGIGNMFMKDDGFGSAVVKRMANKKFPEGVEVKDFGTGGLKLAYDLMRGYDGLIFLDASARGKTTSLISHAAPWFKKCWMLVLSPTGQEKASRFNLFARRK